MELTGNPSCIQEAHTYLGSGGTSVLHVPLLASGPLALGENGTVKIWPRAALRKLAGHQEGKLCTPGWQRDGQWCRGPSAPLRHPFSLINHTWGFDPFFFKSTFAKIHVIKKIIKKEGTQNVNLFPLPLWPWRCHHRQFVRSFPTVNKALK